MEQEPEIVSNELVKLKVSADNNIIYRVLSCSIHRGKKPPDAGPLIQQCTVRFLSSPALLK